MVDDNASIDRTEEKQRRIREQFLQGMPFKYEKVLLKENDNIAANKLCGIIKRRVRINQIHPEPSHTTAFNALNASSNPAVVEALENMAAGIASMQVSQSENQKFPAFSSQPNLTTTVEKELSVRKTGQDNSTLKTDKTLNVSSTHTKEAEDEERIGHKTEEASQETGFIIGTNKDCLTITEKDPQRHSELTLGHVSALSTLPEIVLGDNWHTEMETCLSTNSQKLNHLHAFLQNLDNRTSTLRERFFCTFTIRIRFYQSHCWYRSVQQCDVTKHINKIKSITNMTTI